MSTKTTGQLSVKRIRKVKSGDYMMDIDMPEELQNALFNQALTENKLTPQELYFQTKNKNLTFKQTLINAQFLNIITDFAHDALQSEAVKITTKHKSRSLNAKTKTKKPRRKAQRPKKQTSV